MSRESFEGMTVPEGEPAEIERIAGDFAGLAGSMASMSAQLRSVPSAMTEWHGPGSVAFVEMAHAQGDALHQAAETFAQARAAADQYAVELREAQETTREAIATARQARRDIDDATAEIASSRAAIQAAEARYQDAVMRSALPSFAGGTDTFGEQQAALAAREAAEERLATALRKLEEAETAMRIAKDQAIAAEEDADRAQNRLADLYDDISATTPVVAALGAPAVAATTSGGLPLSTHGVEVGPLSTSDLITLYGGGSAGVKIHRIMAQHRRARERLAATDPKHWRATPLTPAQRAAVQASHARAQTHADAVRSRTLGEMFTKGSVVLEGAGAYFQFKENQAEGMSTEENLVRTATSTTTSALGGAGLGALCAATGVGAPAAAACGMGGAWFGGKVGDALGGPLYDVGSAVEKVIPEASERGVGRAVDTVVETFTDPAKHLRNLPLGG